ncbi:hypothetical protein L7F22_046796 [Adiantum nelumboides]|nr:hypothetical protein [Adiantum nelumboides]
MRGDMFPLPQQIPNRANDYALDVMGDQGAEQENQASTSGGHVGIVRVEKKEADMMPLGKREREGYAAPGPSKKKGKDAKAKRKRRPCKKFEVTDLPLGEGQTAYDLKEDLIGRKIDCTFGQLMNMVPKLKRQWKSLVNPVKEPKHGQVRVLAMGELPDICPVVNAWHKGVGMGEAYIDGGAQVCVITQSCVERFGLITCESSGFRIRLANHAKVKCLGLIKNLEIEVLSVKAMVNFHVMPAGLGAFPLILGRPWLRAVGAVQDWGKGTICVYGKKGEKMVFDMTTKQPLELEDMSENDESNITSEDSSEESESSATSSSSDEGEVSFLLLDEEKKEVGEVMQVSENVLASSPLEQLEELMQPKQELQFEGAKPVRQKLRRMGKEQMNALKEEVDKLLNAGFIVPVDNAEWVSPVVVTPKKDGRWRVCIDYKPLNAVTKKDSYPLPFIDQLLDAVTGFERYSVCDGYSGYFQLILAPEDRKKTTFITPWGSFCFCCLPFGLTNGPRAFERKVDWVFNPFLGKFVKGFIDDFCVYSPWKEHVQKLEMTFARYDECEGQLNPEKCHLAQPRVKLLGHVIFENGIEADLEKVEALLLLSSPKDTRQLATFI